MTRLTLALAAWLALVSVAPASLSPRKERLPLDPDVAPAPARQFSALAVKPSAASEYVVTELTEILLDGKPCRYEDVPEKATILRMEVAPDGKTVLRAHFRTGK
jgi:hypothetical protein